MGSAATIKVVASGGETLPQGVVGSSVDTTDLLPFIQDGAQTITGGLPVGGVIANFFGFFSQLGFLGGVFFTALCFDLDGLLSSRLRIRNQGIETTLKSLNVSDDGHRRHLSFEFLCRLIRGFTFSRVVGNALFQQLNFGDNILVAVSIVGEGGVAIAGLPLADLPFGVSGDQVDGSVVGDFAELFDLCGGWHVGQRLRCASSGGATWAGTRLGSGSGLRRC